MWKQSVLKKVIRPKRRQIKIVVQIKANFNQTIFPQSIFIFNLWKFEQEDARSNAIHKLFLLLLVFPSFILCAALLLDLDADHAATRFLRSKSRNEVQNLLQDHLWLLDFHRCKPNGGSIKGTCVYFYHASKIDVFDVGHLVVQVSGAADHLGEDLLSKNWRWEMLNVLDFRRGIGTTSPFCLFLFLNFPFM